MKTPTDAFRLNIASAISASITKSFSLELQPEDCAGDLAPAPNLDLGHIAFPCFKFSKALKKSPKDIATQLAADWVDTPFVLKVKAAGPYLNLFLKPEYFAETVLTPMRKNEYFAIPKDEKEAPFLIEYSQPNTHKELHVGHMRNLCYGLSLISLYRYCGHNVISCTFPGDVGTHVAKCLWYMKNHNQEQPPAEGKGQWLGKMYTLANNKLEDEKGSDKEDGNREQLTAILQQLEKGEGPDYDLWKETRQWSIDLMESVYDWAGVEFDHWYWESDVDSTSVDLVKGLHKKGLLVEDQGAVGLHLDEKKLGFCLLLKSDGNGLYSTKDLELARRKFAEFSPQKNIVIVDMRQELHFRQVFAAFEKLGLGDAEKCIHLKYNFVELPDGAMSSRKGNIVPISELIENMKQTIKTDYLARYTESWSTEDIEKTADTVAQGAIKYGMNRMDPNKKIVFDMKEWLRLDGESGPYVQYAHARICSLLEKLGNPESSAESQSIDWSLLVEGPEVALMVQLASFQVSMQKALVAYKTSSICSYAYDLAKSFNSFYQACPIGKIDNKDLANARLALVDATRMALEKSLGLLAIPAPQKM